MRNRVSSILLVMAMLFGGLAFGVAHETVTAEDAGAYQLGNCQFQWYAFQSGGNVYARYNYMSGNCSGAGWAKMYMHTNSCYTGYYGYLSTPLTNYDKTIHVGPNYLINYYRRYVNSTYYGCSGV